MKPAKKRTAPAGAAPEPLNLPPLWRDQDVLDYLDMSRPTLLKLVRKGELVPDGHVCGRRRWRPATVETYLASGIDDGENDTTGESHDETRTRKGD